MSGQDGLEAAIAALLGGSACGLALDEIEFAALGLAFAAIGELAGQSAAVERALATGKVAGLASGFARAGRLDGLVDDPLGDGRILLKEHAELFVDQRLDDAGDVGVQLALGLALELRLRQLDADDRDEAFANVVSGEVFLHVFEEAELLAGVVDGAGERGLESGQVRAAVDGVDVVGEGEDRLGVAVVVLKRDLHIDAIAQSLPSRSACRAEPACPVDVLDELGDAAGVFELGALGLAGLGVGGALIGKRDFEALVQEGEFAQPLRQGVVVVFGDGEDGSIGQEVNLGAALLRGARLAQLRCGDATRVVLLVCVARARSQHRRLRSSALTQETPTPCRPPETL